MNTHNVTSHNSPITTCIVYDDDEPIHMFYDKLEAHDYMTQYGDRKIESVKNILWKASVSDSPNAFVNIRMSIITHTQNGVCTSCKWYDYLPQANDLIFKHPKSNHFAADSLPLRDERKMSLPGESLNTAIRMTTRSEPPYENKITLHDCQNLNLNKVNNISEAAKALRMTNLNNNNSKCGASNFNDEMIKLTKALTETSEQNKKTLIPDLEKVYSGVAEEAMLDDEIKRMKGQFDDALSDAHSDVNSDNDLISSDHEDGKYMHNDDDSNESNENGQFEITDDMPDELKHLMGIRNALSDNIHEQSVIVNKANEKLNEDIFNKRCEEQDRRRKQQKELEGISILKSDKNVYLKLNGKIKEGILREKNIPPLFVHKYHIIRFMETNECIEFTKDADVKNEYHIFSQLQKVVDLYELNSDDSGDSRESNSNDSVEYVNDDGAKNKLIDDIDPNYMNLCTEFLELLDQSNGAITSDKKIHSILNDNPDIKKAIFKEEVDTTVFEKDTDKEHYTKTENKN